MLSRPYARTRLRTRTALALAVLGAATWGCPAKDGSDPALPPLAVYAMPSNFAGEWMGEVGAVAGTLQISELGRGRYYGLFHGESEPMRLSLSIDHKMATDATGAPVPSNLVTFIWQDGRGGRGAGWLLINREDSALAGAYGMSEDRSTGLGEWTFIRLE